VGAVTAPLPFRRLLVANRGEIARRVILTARRLGLSTVAVYSEADADQLHVREADRAVCVGGREARRSYLDVEAIVRAARESGADAVHPGYGFLSESAVLARALEDAGIVFVGPPAAVLEASADKLVVKRRVAAAGVPVIPGPLEAVGEDPAALARAAKATGFPLLLKAAAGGGGKGMRRVERAPDLAAAAEGARREARGAFGDGALYLERLLAAARHVEVQVLADAHGAVVTLGERDCSLQRRHQKVLEECPAPGLAPETARRLHAAGAEAAKALGYQGAGTVEFLLDDSGAFHFLEVNRRLQVEHPVTEACYGVDLVAWQLRLAAGERLPPPGRFVARGHAVEARVYAEDPARDFLPSPGTVLRAILPEGPGVRVDHALFDGAKVPPEYDPLLAKVVAHGETREEAFGRLDLALAQTAVLGVRNNVGFLRRVLADEDVRAGRVHAHLLEARLAALAPAADRLAEAVLAAAAEELARGPGLAARAAGASGVPAPSPWHALPGFRLGEEGR
jgi:acetyl-CoA/propionyl-CoA carboxylase biotin carboxyl carrier protein